MGVYVAFLRGINVSGHNMLKMAALKNVLETLQLKDISTYLQSGNVIFTSDSGDIRQLGMMISNAIQNNFGLDIKVKVIAKDDFIKGFLKNPLLPREQHSTKFLYYIHLMGKADIELFNELKQDEKFEEEMHLDGEVIYMFYPNGYGRTRIHNNYLERKLKVSATARNHNTMTNLCRLLETYP